MSRTSVRIALAIVLVAVVFAVAGCLDETARANDAIRAANEAAKRYAELDERIAGLMDEAGAVDFTRDGATKGIEALDEARAALEERAVVIASMKAAFEGILGMRVSEELKTYARQQVEITDLLVEMDEAGLTIVRDMRSLYEMVAAGDADAQKADELSKAIAASTERMTQLQRAIVEKQAASEAYFEEQHLGGE